MTYEETKKFLKENLNETLLNELFPSLSSINFIKLFDFLFEAIDKAVKEEEDKALPDDFATDIRSILLRLNDLLIFQNLDEKRFHFIEAINLLLLNASSLYKLPDEIKIASKNNILIRTQYNLKLNIDILRGLIYDIRRVVSFKPRGLFYSEMYLDTLDKYFDLAKDDSSEYGLLDEKIIKKLEQNDEDSNG